MSGLVLAALFAVCAVAIARAGYVLSATGDALADAHGWGRGWVGLALLATVTSLPELAAGTLLMAAVTTLPEAAVTLGALRIGVLDLAIGNLLGSNLFNVTILAIDDLFYRPGPLLADASPVHAGTAISAIVMSGLVIVGLVMRPRGRVLRTTSWVGIGLAAAYLLNATIVALS